MMRASSCPTKLYVNVNVEVADQKKTLTIFDDILKATLGELDDQSVDTIAKQLLLLENISITFNNKNVVTKMEVTSLLNNICKMASWHYCKTTIVVAEHFYNI